MADFQIPKHGTLCWRELETRDLPAALDFYKEMFGWTLQQSAVSPMEYKEIHIDGTACGGMMAIDENWGPTPPPSHWTTYIAVDTRTRPFPGSSRMAELSAYRRSTLRGVGRMSVAADPSGAKFAIIQFVAA